MRSLWLDRQLPVGNDPFPSDNSFDDLVVGAGLTGLTTALLLARSGRQVGVVEARHVGAVTTGRTTAKLSLLQGTKLSEMLSRQTRRVAAAYIEANLEGQQWLLRFCEDHGVPTQTRDAITFAAKPDEIRKVRKEHEAAISLGLDVSWADSVDVPFPLHGATILPGQAQLDPLDVLAALVEQLRSHGGTLHEGHRVLEVSRRGTPTAELEDGRRLRAANVILATGIPVLDRGLYWAKVDPKRSYVTVYRGATPPSGMYLSVGSSSRSIRDVPRDGETLLMVGGSGHTVGRVSSEAKHVDELRAWTAQHFPGAVETHAWSAQDYSPPDGVPYVGRMPRGGKHVWLATGYDKWGMTNAVAAARTISAEILGESPSWAKVLHSRMPTPKKALGLVALNAGVGVAAVRSYLSAATHGVPEASPPSGGQVGHAGLVPVGVSEGATGRCELVAVCTHLGGTLHWNDAERSWDCPLHGSRFAADGAVLEGPATKPLVRRTS